jgi:hypothetical protein
MRRSRGVHFCRAGRGAAALPVLGLALLAACTEDVRVVVVPLCANAPAGVTQLQVTVTLASGQKSEETYDTTGPSQGAGDHAFAVGLDATELMSPRDLTVDAQDAGGHTLASAAAQIVDGNVQPECLFLLAPGECMPSAHGAGAGTGCAQGQRCHPVSRTCVAACVSDASCDPGHSCNSTWSVCLSAGPSSATDMPAIGSPCIADTDCPANGRCLTDGDGYPGGYCSYAQCNADPVTFPCTGQAACLDLVSGVSACFHACRASNQGSDCRPGYICQVIGEKAVCLPG